MVILFWRWSCVKSVGVTPLIQNRLYSPDLTVLQPYFDPSRMMGGGCQDIFNNPNGSLAGALILLQDDFDTQAGTNIFALLSIHFFLLPLELQFCMIV